MKRYKSILIITLAISLAVGAAGAGKPTSVLLQEGLYAEEMEGNLDAAIKIYEQIIADGSAQRTHIAQAMYRLGTCYLKQQNEQQAKNIFSRLAAEYPEETSIIEKVQPLLEQMSNPDPAELMPPETLIYMEFGSPGKQIETILNMLKGTPFENPLASICGGGQGQKSPGDVMAALLNPSMMAEFKKIRGMAIGITELQSNNPPCVMAFYPGKSDALRGIILAGLGMVGRQGELIEGMQTLSIAGDGSGAAGVAYDDNVIIIAQPFERLGWCIKQYKGVTKEPSLASSNRLFSKIDRKSRQDNALTIWLDGSAIFPSFTKKFNQVGNAQVRLIDGIADLNSIEEIIAHLSVKERDIVVEANISLAEGHNCLAYNLIRTPNLTKGGFEAVPSDAIGLASVALNEGSAAQSDMIQRQVGKLTGLDIGREIFSNIEQVTVFAVPRGLSKEGTATAGPFTSCLGLALTSRNPQQTHQLLTELLRATELTASSSMKEPAGQQNEPTDGRYRIGMIGKQEIYCYTGQVGKTTVLALSQEVLDTSVAALKGRQSALTAGCLQGTLSQLSPETSKLALINAGGVIRVADYHINWQFNNPQNPIHNQLGRLAKAFDGTSVQLHTSETENNFNVRFSVNNLPPLDSVFPVLMEMSRTDWRAQAKATAPEPADRGSANIAGKVQLGWTPGVNAITHRLYFGSSKEEMELLAEVKKPSDVNLPELAEHKTYYWRVDEVWADGSVITGDVWSFSTLVGKLVGWWKLDEGSGTTATDSSGNGNDGTLHNMGEDAWVEGVEGKALQFDGRDDYISIPDSNTIEFADEPFTVTFWLNNPADSTGCRIIVNGTSGTEFDGASGKRYEISHYGKGFSFAIDDNKTKSKLEIEDAKIATGQWVHITAVRDTAADELRLYRNGKLIKTAADKSGDISSPGEPLFIGAARIEYKQPGTMSSHFKGILDDIRIYDYALSNREIKAIYNSTRKDQPQEKQGTERSLSKQQQQIEAQIKMLESQLETIDKQLEGKVDEQTQRLVREKIEASMEQLRKQLERLEQDEPSVKRQKEGKQMRMEIEIK